jgi:adenine phosphoribosyltransferase
MSVAEKLKNVIREVQDFPKDGIVFKDLSTILLYPELCDEVVNDIIANMPTKPDAIAAIESRGFWFGPMIANRLKIPFLPIRKKGKLPGDTVSIDYDLEYGASTIEMHKGHLQPGWNVMVHDDLLATGGTAVAAAELIEREGGKVHSFTFLVNLSFLNGKEMIEKKGYPFYSVINY